MTQSMSCRRLLAVAIAGVLAFGAVSQANAQARAQSASERRAARAQKSDAKAPVAVVEVYPEATRTSPDTRASAKVTPQLKKMMELYEGDKGAEARAIADEIIANPGANAFDHAFAAQIAAQIAYAADDTPAAMAYLERVLAFNGLGNNDHFAALLMLGQLQLQEDNYAGSLATFDRFMGETKTSKPEHLVLKGNALYRLDRYPEAAAVLKQAIDATPEPKAEWMQLLMAAYAESGNAAEAVKLAEQVAARSPDDKRAQMNLAVVYQQGDMYEKAIGVLERMRAAGQLTEDKEYRQLYVSYLNLDGKESKAVEVINDGFAKGILKPDFQSYLALAQSYYFSDQPGPSIDAYRKAAPLAPDGETYLNLAKALWSEDRIPEAKEAATQAIAKGVKKPAEAKKILALPNK